MPVLEKVECCKFKIKSDIVLISEEGYCQFKNFLKTKDKEKYPFRHEYFSIFNSNIGIDDNLYKVICLNCMDYWYKW